MQKWSAGISQLGMGGDLDGAGIGKFDRDWRLDGP